MQAPILQLGDPRLRQVCTTVTDFQEAAFVSDQRRLHATLAAFRQANGFGRAISAPQIGVSQRFIAMNVRNERLLIVNPEFVWTSEETFTMWDDCMSFPSLLVRLRRHQSISIRFSDENGTVQEWLRLDQPTSELLQHEMDHLDGILAVDRAVDRDSLVLRDVFDAQREYFAKQVDYIIPG
jgi:peptide deformylase